MRILITGATGFIGKKLGLRLAMEGHQLVVLARHPERATPLLPFACEIYSWDPLSEERNHILKDLIRECDAVIHLAGESVAGTRWSKKRKQALLDSRTKTTRSLHDLVGRFPGRKPKVWISASAIGFYGDRGSEVLTEASQAGSGFLADLCKSWEREIFSFHLSETRVVALRFGLVLGRDGGALGKILSLFKIGGSSVLGDGEQWMSWIHWKDLIAAILFCLSNPVEGAFNAVAPEPVTNKVFTQILASRLGVRVLPKVPKFILKLVLGEMSSLLLDSQRVRPARLLEHDFVFAYEKFDSAIHALTQDVEIARGTFANDFVAEQFVAKPVEEIWPFFSEAHNLEKLTPEFLNFEILDQSTPRVEEGTLIDYSLRLHGIPLRWRTKILDWKPNDRFVDLQLKGPYSLWYHLHTFQPLQKGTLITDRVIYRAPMGFLGNLFGGRYILNEVNQIFSYRRQVIHKMFNPHK